MTSEAAFDIAAFVFEEVHFDIGHLEVDLSLSDDTTPHFPAAPLAQPRHSLAAAVDHPLVHASVAHHQAGVGIRPLSLQTSHRLAPTVAAAVADVVVAAVASHGQPQLAEGFHED
jgi:hypothetical protein